MFEQQTRQLQQPFLVSAGAGATTGVVVGEGTGVRVRGKRRAGKEGRKKGKPRVSKMRSMFSFVLAETSMKRMLLSLAYSSASSLGTSLWG